ncbi:uncharacterized protein [Amphiura filiformis]|uniref:uncharacterized protein isoform X2 n=1 Tax=Amphiura filiformis TaxID=82378 RepID=UPI003B222F51
MEPPPHTPPSILYPIASCSGPPSPLCTSTFDPEVDCCPQYSCPEGCADSVGLHETGDEWMTDVCTMCVCPAGEGLRPPVCKGMACGSPPSALCTLVPPTEDQCCPTFECPEPEACTDNNGNTVNHGDSWEEPCGTCFCEDGNSMCPTPLCAAPPPELGCTSIQFDPKIHCCPEYSCPEADPVPEDEVSSATPPPPVPTEQWFFTQDLEDSWVVRYSQPVTLTCGAEVSDPQDVTISFECNGEIMDTSRVTYTAESITPGIVTTYASIDISRGEVEDFNNKFYCQCVASTPDLTEYRSSVAEVGISFFRKAWGKEPTSQIVSAGDSFLLECQPPTGRPDPEVSWEKDGQLLDLNNERVMLMEDGSLVISSATLEDAGSYMCVVQNPAKLRRSKAAVVTVNV